jgi:homoserine kinase
LTRQVPELEIDCHNQIPLARGLGSSSSAITAGLLAANALLGDKMSREELLPIAVEIEGHADNLAPAFFGGCQIVVRDASRLVHEEVPVKDIWKCVLFIPDFEMHTLKARNLLPRHLPREDAVYNIGRVAIIWAE